MFPPVIRRMLPLFVGTLQQPLGFEGFGGVACTRETFQKVISMQYSNKSNFLCYFECF